MGWSVPAFPLDTGSRLAMGQNMPSTVALPSGFAFGARQITTQVKPDNQNCFAARLFQTIIIKETAAPPKSHPEPPAAG